MLPLSTLPSRIASTLRTLLSRRKRQDDIAEELRFHIDQHAQRLMEKGASPAEARRQARAALGTNDLQQHEKQREIAGLRIFDEFWGDVRFGLRGLWHNKGFAAIAILSMALGIGAATAMFSVVYAVLLDIYPYADSARTVNPIVHDPAVPDDWTWFSLTPQQYASYRQAAPFEDVFATSNFGFQLDEDGLQQPIQAVFLSSNANRFNRVPALLGRTLEESDGDLGQPTSNAVVLGYKFWQAHFGADPNVIGKPFRLGKNLLKVVGVMPRRYTLGGVPDVYLPYSVMKTLSPGTTPGILAFAKLKPGVTATEASQMLDPMVHDFARQNPRWYPKNFHVRLQPLLDGFTTRSKLLKNFPMLYLAVGGILLIGCANCSLLLLARGTARTHEFALRAAIGASRVRIVRQLLVESLLISLLGSALGIGLSYVLARLPLQLAANLFPTEAVIRVSLPVLGFSVAVAMLAGVAFGFLPAVRASRPGLNLMLQRSSGRTVAGQGRRALQWLIGAQIALTLVLLTLAVAAASGFRTITRMHLGFNPENTMMVNIGLDDSQTKSWQARVARFEAVQQALSSIPGVTAVSTSDDLPPNAGNGQPIELVGDAALQQRLAHVTMVGADYFRTLSVPLVQGRLWTADEAHQGLPLAVVNAAFVRRFSPGRPVLGRSVRIPAMAVAPSGPREYGPLSSPAFSQAEVQVVGVVEDAVNEGLDKPVAPNIFFSDNLWTYAGRLYLLKTAGEPASHRRSIALAAHQATGKAWIFLLPDTLQEMVEHDPIWSSQRLIAVLLNVFAVFALLLALVGLYSVVAYAVAQRTPEFGIRLALGAQRSQILSLILRNTALTIVSGLFVGLLACLVVRSRFAQWSQYSSRDLLPLLAAVVLLTVAAFLASLVPARRATRIEPSTALRAE